MQIYIFFLVKKLIRYSKIKITFDYQPPQSLLNEVVVDVIETFCSNWLIIQEFYLNLHSFSTRGFFPSCLENLI